MVAGVVVVVAGVVFVGAVTGTVTVTVELGVTIVIVEKYLDFAWAFADHYHVMQRGKIIRSGSTAEESAEDISHLVNI